MCNIKQYTSIIVKLLLDITGLGLRSLQQIVLPNRRRKGNILSSLFLLFIQLAERIIVFKQCLTPLSWAYGKKYIRQGTLIAAWLLCLLSLFEWSGSSASAKQISDRPVNFQSVFHPKNDHAIDSPAGSVVDKAADISLETRYSDHPDFPTGQPNQHSPEKKYLLLCSLRI
jgi:hypothetical protein